MVSINELIKDPQYMDRETLYELRSLVAMYPYYQPARLLMLKNLYILHDASFDEELRKASLYMTDRRVLFNMIEAKHYEIKKSSVEETKKRDENRTVALIDDFLAQIPEESSASTKRKPTVADACVDYVSYLMETQGKREDTDEDSDIFLEKEKAEGSRTLSLIDDFMEQGGRIILPEINDEDDELQDESKFEIQNNNYTSSPPSFLEENTTTSDSIESKSEADAEINASQTANSVTKHEKLDSISSALLSEKLQESFKKGDYSQAKAIIEQLNLNNSEKNIYFADQIRFVDKLIKLTKEM